MVDFLTSRGISTWTGGDSQSDHKEFNHAEVRVKRTNPGFHSIEHRFVQAVALHTLQT